jgi:hypothetical protein
VAADGAVLDEDLLARFVGVEVGGYVAWFAAVGTFDLAGADLVLVVAVTRLGVPVFLRVGLSLRVVIVGIPNHHK